MSIISVIITHGLIIILATIISLMAKYNSATRELGETYGAQFSAIAAFNIQVIISVFVQLRIKNYEYYY